jgi:eukaryotic-like serine/threonine-protein kinase
VAEWLGGDRWRAISEHLDRALALSEEERAAWLAGLRAEDAPLAADLEALLARQRLLHAEGFLEQAPAGLAANIPLAGRTLGPYTLRALIDQGGMGSVWLADRSDGRFSGVAAIKLLNAGLLGRAGEERFRREGTILARLRHANIAHLADAGVSPWGQPYLVLEHVDGERIDRYCDARRLGVEGRVRLMLDVLAAVAHAHAHLIVHRDIKPSNVLVTADGQVKLLDFGIAKLLEADAEELWTALTREGESALTPEYAAPEQLTGEAVTTATDVYALGVLLYVLLTGAHPAGGSSSSAAERLRAIVDVDPPRASEAATAPSPGRRGAATEAAQDRGTTPERLRAALRGDLDNILAKALAKRPQERYASVDALAEDLGRYLRNEPVTARAGSLGYRAAKLVRRNPQAAALAAAVLLVLAMGVAATQKQARQARDHAALADQAARVAETQRDFALRQLSRAEAINDLDAFLLADAAPLGQPILPGDLLARAERIVDRQQQDAPDDRVEILVSIGRQHQVLDRHDDARRVLAKAYALAAPAAEPATRAKAACALASALALGGDTARAERLVAEAERVLPNEPQLAVHRIFCLMRGSEVAQEADDAELGLRRAEEAQRLLATTRTSSLLDLSVAMRLAESFRLLGRYGEAAAAFERAFARLGELGRGDTELAGTLLNNWALAVHFSGRPLAAEPLFRRAVAIGSADASEAAVSPMLLNNLARTLRDLDRLPEAAGYAARASEAARRGGQQVALHQSLLLRSSIHRLAGDLPAAAAALAEVEPMLRRALPEGHVAFAALLREQAAVALRRGDLDGALAAAECAVAIADASSQRVVYLPFLLQLRSEVTLASGLAERAVADAERAVSLELEAAEAGSPSSHVGERYLALARALRALERPNEAREAYAEAHRHLGPSLGEEHPWTREAAGQLAAQATAASAAAADPLSPPTGRR